jgi:hypothetical protein
MLQIVSCRCCDSWPAALKRQRRATESLRQRRSRARSRSWDLPNAPFKGAFGGSASLMRDNSADAKQLGMPQEWERHPRFGSEAVRGAVGGVTDVTGDGPSLTVREQFGTNRRPLVRSSVAQRMRLQDFGNYRRRLRLGLLGRRFSIRKPPSDARLSRRGKHI